jgi:hypothetical protein
MVTAFCLGGVAIKGDLRLSCTSSVKPCEVPSDFVWHGRHVAGVGRGLAFLMAVLHRRRRIEVILRQRRSTHQVLGQLEPRWPDLTILPWRLNTCDNGLSHPWRRALHRRQWRRVRCALRNRLRRVGVHQRSLNILRGGCRRWQALRRWCSRWSARDERGSKLVQHRVD